MICKVRHYVKLPGRNSVNLHGCPKNFFLLRERINGGSQGIRRRCTWTRCAPWERPLRYARFRAPMPWIITLASTSQHRPLTHSARRQPPGRVHNPARPHTCASPRARSRYDVVHDARLHEHAYHIIADAHRKPLLLGHWLLIMFPSLASLLSLLLLRWAALLAIVRVGTPIAGPGGAH